jgi:hypothetical protein
VNGGQRGKSKIIGARTRKGGEEKRKREEVNRMERAEAQRGWMRGTEREVGGKERKRGRKKRERRKWKEQTI